MADQRPPVRVLLVDDEAAFLAATSAALTRRALLVSVSRDAFRALDLIGREEFDVIVVDIRMPFMEGDELFEELRRCRPETPVIILPGHLSPVKTCRLNRTGAAQVLRKPCPTEELLAAILEVVRLPQPSADRPAAS